LRRPRISHLRARRSPKWRVFQARSSHASNNHRSEEPCPTASARAERSTTDLFGGTAAELEALRRHPNLGWGPRGWSGEKVGVDLASQPKRTAACSVHAQVAELVHDHAVEHLERRQQLARPARLPARARTRASGDQSFGLRRQVAADACRLLLEVRHGTRVDAHIMVGGVDGSSPPEGLEPVAE